MTQRLEELNPTLLWKHFSSLCEIPRPSKHEEKVISHVVNFASKHSLEHHVDQMGNIIVRKPATPGLENKKGVIFQTHLDMVPQKNNDTSHDFTKDPIKAYIDGDWVTAEGTTLGADNGIGVATVLAVLEGSEEIKHGPLEALFTIDEETGMTGAKGLSPGLLHGEILLNLDTEDEGEIYVGCAGGKDINITATYTEEHIDASHYEFHEITLKGLRGGHSGLDIDGGRGNANKLLVRSLKALSEFDIRIVSFHGGTLRNAIPREACTVIAVPHINKNKVMQAIDTIAQSLVIEYNAIEPSLTLSVESTRVSFSAVPEITGQQWLNAIDACPSTALRMSAGLPGTTETSNNLAVVTISSGKISIECLSRSLLDDATHATAESIAGLFRLIGAEAVTEGFYPGWRPNLNSEALEVTKQAFKSLFNKEAKVKVIHAGLECGLLSGAYPHWDMVSIGPTIRCAHSPDEKVEIATVSRYWELVKKTLEMIPEKN